MHLKKVSITFAFLGVLAVGSFQLYQFAAADIWAAMGKRQLRDGDYWGAQTHLARSISYTDSNADYYYLYAECLYAQAKQAKNASRALDLIEQAKKAYQKAIKLNPHEGNYWYGLAYTCWWLATFKDYEIHGERVESSFLQALSIDPNNGKFLYAAINYYLSVDEAQKSLIHVERLATIDPPIYGKLRTHPGWSDVVKEHFTRGLRAAEFNTLSGLEALSVLASMAAEEQKWSRAAGYTERLIHRSGSKASPRSYVSLGHYYLKTNEYAKAKNVFLKGIRLSANREHSLQGLLSPLRQSGTFDLYLELCNETAMFDSSVRNDLELILGKAYYSNDDQGLAVEHLRRSLTKRETAEAHRYLAEIAFKKKDWDTAELESQRATVLKPQNAYYHSLFIRSLEAQEKYRPALEAVTLALHRVKPSRHDFYNIQAELLWKLKDYPAAIHAWESASHIAPRNSHYPLRIARAYKKLENFTAAEHYYLATLKLKPDDRRLWRELEALRGLNTGKQ